jgi:transmembrane sensor
MKDPDSRDSLEEAAEWFFRQDGGSLSPAEEARFRAWLAASEDHRAAYAEISGTWHEMGSVPVPARPLRAPARRSRTGFSTSVFRPIAAALAVCLFLTGGAWYLDVPTRVLADNYAAVGELETVTLPDGSVAELNSGSAIALAYSAGERRIRLLKGEAMFTVSADAGRPFIVEALGGEAKALGTVYGVREDGSSVTVTVVESHVAVSVGAGGASVRLNPDERIRYEGGHLGAVEPVDTESETAWRRRKLIFVDRPLGEVVDELNRYHRGMIRIIDGSIRARRISGVFETGDIVGVIDALEKSFGFRDTRLGGFVILIHR